MKYQVSWKFREFVGWTTKTREFKNHLDKSGRYHYGKKDAIGFASRMMKMGMVVFAIKEIKG